MITLNPVKYLSGSVFRLKPILVIFVTLFSVAGLSVKNNVLAQNEHSLPVMRIYADSSDLFGDSAGIYVVGKNGKTGYCDYLNKRNYCQDWEIPVHFDYFGADGTFLYGANAGMKIHGNCSRNFPQKSLALFARKKYGTGSFKYPFFTQKPYLDKFEAFILRNSGNDFNRAHLRDALTAMIVKDKMDIDWQACEPVVVYLNNSYWGVMYLREKLNEHYIAQNHDVDADLIDYLEGPVEVRNGSAESFKAMVEELWAQKYTGEEAYSFLETKIDIPSTIDYLILQFFVENTDWPITNWRYWKPANSSGNWRWIAYDTDYGYNLEKNSGITALRDKALAIDSTDIYRSAPGIIYSALFTSNKFNVQFDEAFNYHLSTTLQTDTLLETFDELISKIKPEMEKHFLLWGGSIEEWELELNLIRTFLIQKSTSALPENIADKIEHVRSGGKF